MTSCQKSAEVYLHKGREMGTRQSYVEGILHSSQGTRNIKVSTYCFTSISYSSSPWPSLFIAVFAAQTDCCCDTTRVVLNSDIEKSRTEFTFLLRGCHSIVWNGTNVMYCGGKGTWLQVSREAHSDRALPVWLLFCRLWKYHTVLPFQLLD
jgi:hypothetical protein